MAGKRSQEGLYSYWPVNGLDSPHTPSVTSETGLFTCKSPLGWKTEPQMVQRQENSLGTGKNKALLCSSVAEAAWLQVSRSQHWGESSD